MGGRMDADGHRPDILAPDAAGIARAVAALRAGRLVGLPTETVYGLAADASNPAAVAAVFAAKGRPGFNPLISHVASLEAACAEAELEPEALALAAAFWPGPLTLVARRRTGGRACDLACAGLDTLALRVPAHPVALAALTALDRPVAAPSANLSGRPSPTLAAHVADDYAGRAAGPDLVLDGGPCAVGLESTVVEVRGGIVTLLRPGGIEAARIAAILGRDPQPPGSAAGTAPRSPGMLLRHYAPDAPVRLGAMAAEPGEVLIGFGKVAGALSLSPEGDVEEAARRLYACLRAADALAPTAIAVAPVPETGLGAVVNERLRRAAERGAPGG